MRSFHITSLDIGHYSVKAVRMQLKSNQLIINRFLDIPLLKDTQDERLLALKEISSHLPLWNKRVSITVPDTEVITKQVTVESNLSPSEQQFAVWQAFSVQSPIALDELSFDYQQLDEHLSPSKEGSLFQVVASRKQWLEERCQELRQASLTPYFVAPHAHALLQVGQWFQQIATSQIWINVEIGYSHTYLTMVSHNGDFYKSIPLGCQQVKDSNPSFIEDLAKQIQRHIQLFTSMYGEVQITSILLSGGGAYLPRLEQDLSLQLGINCTFLKIADMTNIQAPDTRIAEAVFFTAIGSATNALNWMKKCSSH